MNNRYNLIRIYMNPRLRGDHEADYYRLKYLKNNLNGRISGYRNTYPAGN